MFKVKSKMTPMLYLARSNSTAVEIVNILNLKVIKQVFYVESTVTKFKNATFGA